METMVPGRINGTELMVPTQEIMVPTGPDIREQIIVQTVKPISRSGEPVQTNMLNTNLQD